MTNKDFSINHIKEAIEKLKTDIKIIEEKLDSFPVSTTIKIEIEGKDKIKGKINHIDNNSEIQINNESLVKILNNYYADEDDCAVIYVITIDDFLFMSECSKEIIEDYENFKKNNKDDKENKQSMSRIIEENWNEKTNDCLYVGSSHDIGTRIKQHLGLYKNKDTYALYLNSWLFDFIRNKTDCNPKINIFIFNTKILNSEIKNIKNYLQIIEDLMWEAYKPLFGKKGAK